MVPGDVSVYEHYRYQIISIDYIKGDSRRNVFIEQCPELIIVDEAHTCARPHGASTAQQLRHHLLNDISKKKGQHLILLTATPHSGKPEEFHSILGLLKREFEDLDLPTSTQDERRALAQHFVQRKRVDVEKWMDEDTPFPERDAFEWDYTLRGDYLEFFNDVVEFARKLVTPGPEGVTVKRAHYWTALGLLRGIMSSPSAGVKMLQRRRDKLTPIDMSEVSTGEELDDYNPIGDSEDGVLTDTVPIQVMDREDWSEYQRKQLRRFAQQLEEFMGVGNDEKLEVASEIVKDWIENGFNPVIFCRFFETANYLGEHLKPLLLKTITGLVVEVITSEEPDDLRKQRIEDMAGDHPRLLIATDCLSQGINLQELFSAVLHYDLPWNPNDLEQREGRVDRFGQQAPEVKICLLYGNDNPIDGIVLDVLLRKVREIKRSTGINVPFPENSQSIMDTITQSLLLNPHRKIQKYETPQQGALFDLGDFEEAKEAQKKVSRKIDEAVKREKLSRSIFAQNTIKAQEIEEDLKHIDEAIGDPAAVKDFVTGVLRNLFGVQIARERNGYGIVSGNLPNQLTGLLPQQKIIKISFESPTPEGYRYIGRNHHFVEQLCHLVMANTMDREGRRAARAAVIRTNQVDIKTSILLFRCRNVIEKQRGEHQIVAEEMLLWGWRGTPDQPEHLDHEHVHTLLGKVQASSNLSKEAREGFLNNDLKLLDRFDDIFTQIAENQSKQLVDAHERFSALIGPRRYQVVYPVLPMDLMGIYILLPES
ncbi:MAG: helicase-related protein [Bacteroidetes bacterium]|nr:helicase-related protein [Bacteroidota bacterium]